MTMPVRQPSYIVSLSSIPSRFASLPDVLRSLLDQTIPPEQILLYIPYRYRRFPGYNGEIPSVPEGVEIRRVSQDFGPASKVLHAVQDFADVIDGRVNILFADDDLIYERDWAERLLAGRQRNHHAVICAHGRHLDDLGFVRSTPEKVPRAVRQPRWRDLDYQWRKLRCQVALRKTRLQRHEKPFKKHFGTSGYIDIFEGFAGVLVQPRFFDHDAFQIPDILWAVDDVWLSGMVTKNTVPIWLEADATRYRYTPARHADALNSSVIEGADRDRANRLCVEHMQVHYGIWI